MGVCIDTVYIKTDMDQHVELELSWSWSFIAPPLWSLGLRGTDEIALLRDLAWCVRGVNLARLLSLEYVHSAICGVGWFTVRV